MAAGDVLILKVVGNLQSQNVVNSLAFEVDNQAAADADVCEKLCIAFQANIETAWLARHCDDYTLVGYKCFAGKSINPLVPGQLVRGQAGTVVADSLPASICRTITLYPAAIDNHHRGRVMLSSTSVSMLDVNDGGVTTDEVALVQELADLIMEGISDASGDDFTWRVLGENEGVPAVFTIAKATARRTPANITSRRIRELLIG